MKGRPQTIVSAGFDDIRSRHLRFLEEAAKLGELNVFVWPDEMLQRLSGMPPKFPLAERVYFLNAVRYATRVLPLTASADPDALPDPDRVWHSSRIGGERLKGTVPFSSDDLCGSDSLLVLPSDENWDSPRCGTWIWVDEEAAANDRRSAYCRRRGIEYRVLPASQMSGFPEPPPLPSSPGRPKVVATGCYDWFHTGHVRFTEELSAYGDLYIVVGHDANIRLLKGEGHPLFPQAERRYVAGSIKYVTQALIASGDGWLDADPEIRRLKPDIYAVNEDGDRGGKREYCEKMGIRYLVLRRAPAAGLPRRSSTDLRGF